MGQQEEVMYTITVHNAQGASEQHSAPTRKAIDAWLAAWDNPLRLSARVTDQDGNEVAEKPARGRRKLMWKVRAR
jgi:hypothetical protein